ncbi:MAG TPA: hypothetical protein VHJ40_00305, partial [Actinomycetota bacterium]|nr:hypothetical protein [Actinomycetota bacterium]
KLEVMQSDWPALVHSQMDVLLAGGQRDRYQVPVGLRPEGDPALATIDRDSVIALFSTEAGPAYGYDAAEDPELAIALFMHIRPEADPPSRVEPIQGEQSNTSLIYDGRLFSRFSAASPKTPTWTWRSPRPWVGSASGI